MTLHIPKKRVLLTIIFGGILFFVMTWIAFPHTVIGGPQPRGVPFIFAKHGCTEFADTCVNWTNYWALAANIAIWLVIGYIPAWLFTRKPNRSSVGGLT